MCKLAFMLFCLLFLLPLVVFSQKDSMLCDDYIDTLETHLSSLNIRLSAFTRTPASIRSDYIAWQEKRIEWQVITPPECAILLHDDVIAMYANLGDISALGLSLEMEPTSISGNRLVQEAIERAKISIVRLAEVSVENSGNQINTDDISDSLDKIADRFKNG